MDLLNCFISEKWPFRGQVSHCRGPQFMRRWDQPRPRDADHGDVSCRRREDGWIIGALLCGEGMGQNIKTAFVDNDTLLLLFEAILETRSGRFF